MTKTDQDGAALWICEGFIIPASWQALRRHFVAPTSSRLPSCLSLTRRKWNRGKADPSPPFANGATGFGMTDGGATK
jgi:hypothetical protein